MNSRPSANVTWMQVALVVSAMSRCDLAQVGAAIVSADGRVVSTGYNGPPAGYQTGGINQTCRSFCDRAKTGERGKVYGLSCPTVHAEANALIAGRRDDWVGGTIYVTRSCCADCAKLIANSGLAVVVMIVTEDDMHRDPRAVRTFLENCGLRVIVMEDPTK